MSRSDFSADQFLELSLQKRKDQNALRRLITNDHLVDFCSNDYLGFARSKTLKRNTEAAVRKLRGLNGSTGSRLLAGNSSYAEELEAALAKFHEAGAGLIYNSGYDANLGLFASLGQKGDTIIYDELIHASVHDGMRLSAASTYPFLHNNLEHLEDRLRIAQGITYVAVESIYSMDGDSAPLLKMADLCKKYNANLIVDEAHATGITANGGKGQVQELRLEKQVFARVHTFGKALGTHGAIVLGSPLLRDFLINFSRPFIYTTALPPKSLVAISESYRLLSKSRRDIGKLHRKIGLFKKEVSEKARKFLIESNSPIQCVVVSGNENAREMAAAIQKEGFDVRPILNPTVPKGKERLRICIHSYNTDSQLKKLASAVNRYFEKNL
ncbi:MAG: aminotransferase class I/II-fold pyridoxal phosphate-dependent enzyme [Bacteroidia bacterium]